MTIKITLPKISGALEEQDINKCLEKNYNLLTTDWYSILSNWLNNSYSVFKDHEKYLILIFLVKKTFEYYSENFVKLNWEQFFSLKKIDLGKFSIINISRELKISKETTRRKIEEMEKKNIIKKTKSGIIVQPEFYNDKFIKENEVFRKSVCGFISKFSAILAEEKIIKDTIKSNLIEKSVSENFSYSWKVFFEMMLPILIELKILFKDLESCHVWTACILNENYEIKKYIKFKNIKVANKKEFFEIQSKIINKVGINAMSIAGITGIPRATVIRKLNILLKKKYIYVDKQKLYFPNFRINETDIFNKHSALNIKKLSIFINKLLNLSIVSK